MRKLLYVNLLICIIFLAFTFISYAEDFQPPEKANIDWKQFSGETINVMSHSHLGLEILRTMIPEFEALTGMKVVIDDYPFTDFANKIMIDLSTGKPATDVLALNHSLTVMYVEAGWIEPLEPYIQDPSLTDETWYDFEDFPKGSLKGGMHQGKVYGIPKSPDTQILFYRRDLFEQNGLTIPQTMDELYEVAGKLNNPPDISGILLRLSRASGSSWPWNGYVLTYGGYWIDPDTGKPGLNSPETVAATDMYLKLMKDFGPSGALNIGWAEVLANFQQGKGAIIGGDASLFSGSFEDQEKSAVAGKTGYAVLPSSPDGHRSPAAGTAWMWGMSSQSSKKKPAWLLIEWATSKYNAIRFGIEAAEIIRDSVWAREEIAQKYPEDWIQASSETMSKYSEAYVFPRVKEVNALMDIVDVALQKIFTGETTTQAGLDEAQKKTEELLGIK